MTILAALNRHYGRLLAEDRAPPFGYSNEPVGFCVVLDADGAVRRAVDLRVPDGKRLVAPPMAVPQSSKRPGTLPRAFFLWDNSKFVLGLGLDKATKAVARFDAHRAAFRDRHARALAGTDDEGLVALLRFLEGWDPDRHGEAGWWTPDILDQNIAFALDADFRGRRRFLHDRPAAQAAWAKEQGSGEAGGRMCLVTGATAPPARLHPAIKGVWGAQSAGASLVSFNLDAFTSYNKQQGDNAPVSEAAAFGYGTALNSLLAKNSRNRVQVADASTVFWADTAGLADPAAAGGAEALVSALVNPPRPAAEDGEEDVTPTDAEEDARLRDQLQALSEGRPLAEVAPGLDPRTRFFVLGLAPNAARLSVRFWLETDLDALVGAVRQHWEDLRIEPAPWRSPPKAQALLYPVALQGKAENIPPLLGGELMRAVLDERTAYPQALVSAALQRIRAGDQTDRPHVMAARAAIVKAWLTRQSRLGRLLDKQPHREGRYVSLDKTETNPAYRLGRLFALLESIQYRALGSVNAGIRDRYFGAASATPASIFPLLLRGSNHHLSVLRKDPRTRRLAGWFEGQVAEVVDGLGINLPRHFGLEDQGRFVVGYYHQRNDRTKAGTDEAAPADPADLEA